VDDRERIPGNDLCSRGGAVGVIDVFKGQGTVRLDAAGKIGIAAGYQDEVVPGAIDARVKPKVGTKDGERGAHGDKFRGGPGNEQLIRVELIKRTLFIERIDFDAEAGVAVFGAAHHLPRALRERGNGLGVQGRETAE
jgi:hypothetical protein